MATSLGRLPRALTPLLLGLAMVLSLGLAGCSKLGPESTGGKSQGGQGRPPAGEPDAAPSATDLAKALVSGNLTAVKFVGDQATASQAAIGDYTVIMAGMDGIRPVKVDLKGVAYRGKGLATAGLKQTWQIGGKTWTFDTEASMNLVDETWYIVWKPTIVHPQLTDHSRMRHTRELPAREPILDRDGKALMEERNLVQVGIDKANLGKDKWSSSARQLATELKIDPAEYDTKVQSAGDKAFVIAKTISMNEMTSTAINTPGVVSVDITRTRPISPGFAESILGSVGEATPEQAKASKNLFQPGDQVGQSGLSKRYDAWLRGTPGEVITLVKRKSAPKDSDHVDITVFSTEKSAGKSLQLTLSTEQQKKAEQALEGVDQVASVVAINATTGEILAAANSTARPANPDATFGRYAPGSTFKVVTALAMVRQGMSAGTRVSCPATLTVNGRTFKNYNDYPTSKLGTVTLAEALAYSCNTAFIGQATKLPKDALKSAAASLGMGVDFDAGFPVFYGSVPTTDDPVVAAANTIGQGQIEASPLAMAAVAASVAGGKTVVPWLIKGKTPKATAEPLTANEAEQLRLMMQATVQEGAARFLGSKADGAKTGTAEFGNETPPKTHAWMIAYKGDLAVAVMVAEGQSGSSTAGPILSKFLDN